MSFVAFGGRSNVRRFSCESQREPVKASGGARLLQALVSQPPTTYRGSVASRKTLAIIGAGALVDAWLPVMGAMRANGYENVHSANAANFVLARVVYIGRQLEGYTSRVPEGISHRDDFRTKLKGLKDAIADALEGAQLARKLVPRDEFSNVIRETVVEGSDEAAIVTTNWDSVVESEATNVHRGLKTFYLHGNTKGAGAIYLPTEIAEEPYRTEQEKTQLVAIRRDLVNAIAGATRVVLYGIAVSPLDVELGQLLASGLHKSSVAEVHIVDPYFEEVGERVVTLLGDKSSNVKLFGRHPSLLSETTVLPPARSG